MIQTLNALVEYTRGEADRFPEDRERTLITSPGCSARDIQNLGRLIPTLPPKYVDCISRLEISGKCIGYFELSPGRGPIVSELPNLNRFNQDDPLFQHKKRGLIEVASYESNPICVAGEGSEFVPDTTFLVVHDDPMDTDILASDFLSLILLA